MPKDSEGKETGFLSKWAFQEGALSADDLGRKAMADRFVTLPKLDEPVANIIEKSVVSELSNGTQVKSVQLDEVQGELVIET